jgi:hypothetical protein
MKPTMTSYSDLKRAAATFFSELGEWSYDEWKRMNSEFFGNANEPGAILWGLTPYGCGLAYYSFMHNSITMHTSLVYPSTDAPWSIENLGKKYASDVLLHEMMHQYIHQMSLPVTSDSHNDPSWCAEVNRIGALLGFKNMLRAEVVKQRRVEGKRKWLPKPGCMARKDFAEFPHSQRPDGFYSYR